MDVPILFCLEGRVRQREIQKGGMRLPHRLIDIMRINPPLCVDHKGLCSGGPELILGHVQPISVIEWLNLQLTNKVWN